MRIGVTVGELSTKDIVSLRRTEDGSINIVVSNRLYKAVYQRTPNGNFLLSSTYPENKFRQMSEALAEIGTEIERRCIELSEAELRIDYKPVCIDNQQRITVGQSNSLTIYISVENFEHRALFHYNGQKVQFIRSNYPPEQGSMLTELITRNFSKIVEVMEENNMIEPSKRKKDSKAKLFKESFSSSMTETGKRERQRVDDIITSLFQELDEKEYSNLEIQAMIMQSVFETALKYRTQRQRR